MKDRSFRSMCTTSASTVEFWLIPLINTWSPLDRHLNGHLDQHLIDISIATRSTLNWHWSWSKVGRESTNFPRHAIKCWLTHVSGLTLCQLSNNCQSSVDQGPTKMLIKCQSSVDQVSIKMSIKGQVSRIRWSVDQGYWSTLDRRFL